MSFPSVFHTYSRSYITIESSGSKIVAKVFSMCCSLEREAISLAEAVKINTNLIKLHSIGYNNILRRPYWWGEVVNLF